MTPHTRLLYFTDTPNDEQATAMIDALIQSDVNFSMLYEPGWSPEREPKQQFLYVRPEDYDRASKIRRTIFDTIGGRK